MPTSPVSKAVTNPLPARSSSFRAGTSSPHLHFKVAKRGYRELTTQMFFANEELIVTGQIAAA